MKRKHSLMRLLGVLAVAAMIITACAPPATPAPTAVPQPTSVPPTQPPAPTVAAPTTAAPTVAAPPTTAPTAAPSPTAGCAAPVDVKSMPVPANPKKVTLALSQEPDNLNGYFSNMSYSEWIGQMTTVSLVKWDDKNLLVPELASDVPSTANGGLSADGLTITFHLRKCLYWSDGQPITSKDVAFTWQTNVDKNNAVLSRAGWNQITGVDTPDDQTAVVHFSTVYPPWPTLFAEGANSTGPLLPEHVLKGKVPLDKDPEAHLPTVFSGPFMVTEWVAGDHLTLTANPNYWQGHAKLDQIQAKFVPTPEQALAALKAGDIDFAPDFTEADIDTLDGLKPAVHSVAIQTPNFEHYFFNLGTTAGVKDASGTVVGQSDLEGACALKDVNVRKAIIMGIDRQTIVDKLLYGKTTNPADLWPNTPWENTSLKPYPFDPTQAGQLLDTAGYKVGGDGIRSGQCGGKTVKLSFKFETTNRQIRKDLAVIVQQELKAIGIEFKPTHLPAGTFFGQYSAGADMPTGKYDIAGYTTGFYPDPWNDNFLCNAIPNKTTKAGDNLYHYCDPAFDKMWADANATADPAARKKVFDQIQQYMYDNALVIPMYARADVYGVSGHFNTGPGAANGALFWDSFNWDVTQ